MPTINRYEFFDVLRQFIDTKDVNESRIFPDRIEVFRTVHDEDGKLLRDGSGNLQRSAETYWLTSGPSVSTAILATQN